MTVGENVLYLKDVNKAIERIAELEKENAELKGYKNIVDTIKAEGFETFCEVRMFLQHHKELEEENKRLKQCGTVNTVNK